MSAWARVAPIIIIVLCIAIVTLLSSPDMTANLVRIIHGGCPP